MWMPFRRSAQTAVAALALSLIATACGTGNDDGDDNEAGPTRTDLVIAQHAPLKDLHANTRGKTRALLTDQIYNVLIRYYEGNPEPQPELASSWEVSPDGTSITLHLEEGVTFHDGHPFTSEDVAFTIDYVRDPENAANAKVAADLITDVQTPDEHTVVINFSAPNPAMFDMFTILYMLDHRHPVDADASGNGTGPFVVEEFVPDQHLILARNDDYWRDPPQLEKVTIQLLPDPQTKLAQLRAGTVDLITEVPAVDFESFANSDEWVTGATAGHDLYQSFVINTTEPPFDDPLVRQALSLAVNRERIAAEAIGAGSQAGCLPYSEEPWPTSRTSRSSAVSIWRRRRPSCNKLE